MAPWAWSNAEGQQRWRPRPGARRRDSKDGALSLEQGGGRAKMAPQAWSKAEDSKHGVLDLE